MFCTHVGIVLKRYYLYMIFMLENLYYNFMVN